MLSLSALLVSAIMVVQGYTVCERGKYGEHCNLTCPQNCAFVPPSNLQFCIRDTGECSEGCQRGWHGDLCETGCNINCPEKTCNKQTGHCTLDCNGTNVGVFCNVTRDCGRGLYGDLCQHPCSINCLEERCHHTTGVCILGCSGTYTGDFCNTTKVVNNKEDANSLDAVLGPVSLSVVVAVPVIVIVIVIVIVAVKFKVFKRRRRRKNREQGQTKRKSENGDQVAASQSSMEQETSLLQDVAAEVHGLEDKVEVDRTLDTITQCVDKRKHQEILKKEISEEKVRADRLTEMQSYIGRVLDELGDNPPPVLTDLQVNRDLDMGIPQPKSRLEDQEWFHGVLPREEVERLLNNDGDYLVRESKNKQTNETQYVLSVYWSGYIHSIIQGDNGAWKVGRMSDPTIPGLIFKLHCSKESILQTPILREEWELMNDDISLEMKIGNGNFSEVYKGLYTPKNLIVAVKTCKDTLSEEQRKKFLQEGRILKQYDHPNIVCFIGIAAQRQPVMIVTEFVAGGALLGFLRKQGKSQNKGQLTRMCLDSASGMAYLEARGCIHRDLAARNCLVGDNNIVKISNFWMSREEEEYTVSESMKQISIKWTAPEALNYGKYTTICDVWSYGILMWEIFSGGTTPYPGWTYGQSREKIEDGYRMPAPVGTPSEVYMLMLRCWEYDPERRPKFEEICKELKRIGKHI